MISDAVISEDGRYRYSLFREVNPDEVNEVLFVMLNPSTADAYLDDPTIRRCQGFAQRWGFRGLFVANLYAFRAAKPTDLAAAADPIGPENDAYLRDLSGRVHTVVAAWGANKMANGDRVEQVNALIGARRTIWCLGRTAKGHPRHPLYVKGDTPASVYRGVALA